MLEIFSLNVYLIITADGRDSCPQYVQQ